MVRTNTVVLPGMGAGVVRIKDTKRALALSVDCNGRFVYLDPFVGAQLAVAEASRNVACAGGLPIGATNCLNFGNPQKPDIMWQFVKAVEGMGAACRALDIPITGGNVSLYNETDGRGVLPTPVLGVVGLIEDASTVVRRLVPARGRRRHPARREQARAGRQRVSEDDARPGAGRAAGARPRARRPRCSGCWSPARAQGLFKSAHDCAEGGVAVTVAECCFSGTPGVDVDLPPVDAEAGFGDIATLFGESASRAVVSVAAAREREALELAGKAGVPAAVIGRVGGGRVRLSIAGRRVIDEAVDTAERIWDGAIASRFERTVA